MQGDQRRRLVGEAKLYALFLIFYTALVLYTRPGLPGVQMLDGAKRVPAHLWRHHKSRLTCLDENRKHDMILHDFCTVCRTFSVNLFCAVQMLTEEPFVSASQATAATVHDPVLF